MSEQIKNMRWGVEQRLEFIEFQLFWEGGINRADITRFFGVSVPQASKDLSQYQEIAPKNILYDKSKKRYFATDSFRPLFLKTDADQYFTQLASSIDQSPTGAQTWLASFPDVGIMPVPHRRVDVTVLRSVLAAIRKPASIEILYQSMNTSRPEPIWRRITPHAFGHDGLRWHIRAFCHIDNKFKDFILSRCIQAGTEGQLGNHAQADTCWYEVFQVILSPNPALSKIQQAIIAQDYGMNEQQISVPVRKALLYYFSKRLRLDVAGIIDNPYEVPVIVRNLKDFEIALAEAMS